MEKRIVIIGAGPAGLGAAYRLKESGYKNWAIYERNSYLGGLSASFRDKAGFTWDIGGHIIFSSYPYFEKLVEKLLAGEYLEHQRRSHIRIKERWVPYPFQNNIRYLAKEEMLDCLLGLIRAQKGNINSYNFKDWILSVFGEGIAKYFMFPHNQKVWSYPLEEMSNDWIAERVSIVDIERVLKNIILNKDDISWGPNNTFKFPLYGGTGGLFEKFEPVIKGHLYFNKELAEVNAREKELGFKDGSRERYDILINTSPLDKFTGMIKPPAEKPLNEAKSLKHNGCFVVGVGLEGKCPDSKCWMYFPEDNAPFYRVTYLSNYSPNNVPGDGLYYSLLCETSYSEFNPWRKEDIVDKTIEGLINCRLISREERNNVVSTYLIDSEYSYPVPTLGRNKALKSLHAYLESREIYSRGRFGGWTYEVGNMDHSLMQGKEVIDRVLSGEKEKTKEIPF